MQDKIAIVFVSVKNILEQITAIFSPMEYITFSYRGLVVDAPLWAVIVGLLGMFFIIFFILYCINIIFNLIPNYKKWLKNRRIKQANNYTALAISFLSEGNIIDTEKYALKGLKNSSIPLVNYLSLAATANSQGNIYVRDKYFAEAYEKFTIHQTAIILAKAKMQFEQGDFTGCITTIQNNKRKIRKHPQSIYLLSFCYQQEKRWQDLLNILPKFNKLFPDSKYQNLELQAYQNVITNVAVTLKNKQALIDCWGEIPKKWRQNNDLVVAYAEHLNRLGAELEAEKVLRDRLNVNLDISLLQLYGKINCTTNIQIKKISDWLEKFPENPELLLTAAKICVKNKLWGKARKYLELSLALDPKPESFAALGNLLEYLGEKEQSKICFRQGLLKVLDQ